MCRVFLFPILFVGWKILKRTKWVKFEDVDLVTDLAEIEEYHRTFVDKPETNAFNRVLDKLFGEKSVNTNMVTWGNHRVQLSPVYICSIWVEKRLALLNLGVDSVNETHVTYCSKRASPNKSTHVRLDDHHSDLSCMILISIHLRNYMS